MEIINEGTQMNEYNVPGCSSDALLPPHTCMSKGGGGDCPPYSDQCSRCHYTCSANSNAYEYMWHDQ